VEFLETTQTMSAPRKGTIFAVPLSAVIVARLEAFIYFGLGLYVVSLLLRMEEGLAEVWQSQSWIVGLIALGIAAPLFMAWLGWRKVPAGSLGGTLRIGPDGVDYTVGAAHRFTPWARIAAIHPISRPNGEAPAALWLPGDDAARPGTARVRVLQIVMRRAPNRPADLEDGLLLPIALFGRAQVPQIIETMERHRAAAKPERQAQ
jgi:hypothetical protein